MDKYKVKLAPKAVQDLERIYQYIASEKQTPVIAKGQIDRIKEAILNLSIFPYAHQVRKEGKYAKRGYRQLLVDNYIVVYRIDEVPKIVYVVTAQYQRRNL